MEELTWEELEKQLPPLTSEEEAQMKFEMQLIQAAINARQRKHISQRKLSELTGIKQPSIAKIESGKRIPKVDTLQKLLLAMGYTLKVVPLDEK